MGVARWRKQNAGWKGVEGTAWQETRGGGVRKVLTSVLMWGNVWNDGEDLGHRRWRGQKCAYDERRGPGISWVEHAAENDVSR